eukprot:1617080-Alexandrium_andersonii.AAC.1
MAFSLAPLKCGDRAAIETTFLPHRPKDVTALPQGHQPVALGKVALGHRSLLGKGAGAARLWPVVLQARAN